MGSNGQGSAERDNKIFSWGYNQNEYGHLELKGGPSLAYYIETFYQEPDGNQWMETYIQFVNHNDNSTIRPFMTSINRKTYHINSKITADYLTIDRHDGRQLCYFDPNGFFLTRSNAAIYKNHNNQPAFLQRKADGINYACLLKLDNQDRLAFDIPLYVAAAPGKSIPITAGFTEPGAGPALQLTHLNADRSGASISWRNETMEVARIQEQCRDGAFSLSFYTSSAEGSLSNKMTLSGSGALGLGTVNPASTLHVKGNEQHLVTTVTGATTLDTHHTVMCNNATVPFTVTLPPASAWIAGRQYTIKNIGAAAVTVAGAGGIERIDGAAKKVLPQWAAVTVQCGTTNDTEHQWFITAGY
jgi:hypothetical protein